MNEKLLKKKTTCQKNHPDFATAVDVMDEEQIKQKMTTLARYREEIEVAKSNDEALQVAKDVVSELNAPYREALKAIKEKLAYLYIISEEKKGAL